MYGHDKQKEKYLQWRIAVYVLAFSINSAFVVISKSDLDCSFKYNKVLIHRITANNETSLYNDPVVIKSRISFHLQRHYMSSHTVLYFDNHNS